MPKFRIMPGHRVQGQTTEYREGMMVKRSFLKPDIITVRLGDGREIEKSEALYDVRPDPGNVPMIIIKAITAKAVSQKWSRQRLIEEITRYCDRILEGK
jgi:hypothetical protein